MGYSIFHNIRHLAFFFLGAGVLNNVNELQEILATSSFWEVDVISALQNMFSLVLGGWAKWLFIILAFFVLFSTLLSGTAAFTRTISDYLISMGLVKEKEHTRNNLIKLVAFGIPFLSGLFYFILPNPFTLLLIAGIWAALGLPIVNIGALYLISKLEPSLQPKLVTIIILWISLILQLSMAALIIYDMVLDFKMQNNELIKWPFLKQTWGIEFEKSDGMYLYTKEGQKILDAAGGAIVSNIGYGREDVAEAVADALKNNSYILPPFLTPEREALLDELREYWLPPHLSRIHLSSGGSEANESAVKLAIQYQASRGKPEKNIILTRSLSYHGTTLNMSGISGHIARKRGLESYVPEPRTIETPYPLRCPLGSFHPDAKDYYLDNLRETIKTLGANKIAALLMEPINGSSGGAISPPEGYWLEAEEILKENDILLIADEVMTGFGRVGVDFASNMFGLKPDILVAGKGMGGGYAAIGGTYSTEEIADSIQKAGYEVMFHTFAALPHSCAASSKVLKILREEELCKRVKPLGIRF